MYINKIYKVIMGGDDRPLVLGEGSFADVVLAVDKTTDTQVAIKRLDLTGKSAKARMYYLRELENHAVLIHQHIVSMKDVFVTQDEGTLVLCIVMEFMPGGDLLEVLKSYPNFPKRPGVLVPSNFQSDPTPGIGKVPERDTRRMFQEMLLGVDYCHHKKVVVRDIKPQNVLVCFGADGLAHVKLADFGWSKDVAESQARTLAGTYLYCAPEVLCHGPEGYDGTKADTWSLGCVLYNLLLGEAPICPPKQSKDMPQAAVSKHLIMAANSRDYKTSRFKRLSSECQDLLNGLLDPDPKTRFSVQDALNHPWVRVDWPAGADAAQQTQKERETTQNNPVLDKVKSLEPVIQGFK